MVVVLAAAPDDVDALKCKVVALIHQDKYDEVLSSLQGCSNRSALVFEEAYALYRLKKLPESLALLSNDQDKKSLELKGQVVCFTKNNWRLIISSILWRNSKKLLVSTKPLSKNLMLPTMTF